MANKLEVVTVKKTKQNKTDLLGSPGAHDWGGMPGGQLIRGWGYSSGYDYTHSLHFYLHYHNHSKISIYFAVEGLRGCYAIVFLLALVKPSLTSPSHNLGIGHSIKFFFFFGGLRIHGWVVGKRLPGAVCSLCWRNLILLSSLRFCTGFIP